MHLYNPEIGNLFGLRHGFKVCTGVRYLGDFIRNDNSKRDWLLDHTLKWENNIRTISETVEKYTEEIYAAVVRAIKLEWIFL